MSLAGAALAWALVCAHRVAGLISLDPTLAEPPNASANLLASEGWPKWPQWSMPQGLVWPHQAGTPQGHHPAHRPAGANASVTTGARHGGANASRTVNADARADQPQGPWGECQESDVVNFALMSKRICEINWMLHPNMSSKPGLPNWIPRPPTWSETKYVGGCWLLKEYNTDFHQSTGVYSNIKDRRCVLAVSGFHGTLVGIQKAMAELLDPPERWRTCNSFMYAPFVRTWRHHTALGNWSKIARYLSTSCSSVTITGESLGGSSAEILAACSSSHQLWQLQPALLPSFHVHAIHTFGAMASATVPLGNSSGHNHCFHGKRWFHTSDIISKLGVSFSLVHPLMDATEVFADSPGSYRFRSYKCRSRLSIRDNLTEDLEPTFASMMSRRTPKWATAHEITSYLTALRWSKSHGIALYQKPSGYDYVELMNSSRRFDWAYALRASTSEF